VLLQLQESTKRFLIILSLVGFYCLLKGGVNRSIGHKEQRQA
jgi:hypothetical protein